LREELRRCFLMHLSRRYSNPAIRQGIQRLRRVIAEDTSG
jgi:hypothetical protein